MLYICCTKWATLGHPLCSLVKKKGMGELGKLVNMYTNALHMHERVSC